MAINANMNTSYELSNYEELLASVIERATVEMNKTKDGAAVLKTKIQESVVADNFVGVHQVGKPDFGRRMTIKELCDSYVHETIPQLVDPNAVARVLFGPDGLIRKTGGGRAKYLLQDIEVGYIKDPLAGTLIGPVITSGRNRTIALQVMLRAAGLPQAAINMLKVRVAVVEVRTAAELQNLIIAHNSGGRDPSRDEVRVRKASSGGVVLVDRSHIEGSIHLANNEKEFKAAMSVWVKEAAMSSGLNTFTPAQYSDAGNSLWNALAKANRIDGLTFYMWCKKDTTRFLQIARAAEAALPTAVSSAANNKEAGPIASKLAKVMAPVVASRCGLNA